MSALIAFGRSDQRGARLGPPGGCSRSLDHAEHTNSGLLTVAPPPRQTSILKLYKLSFKVIYCLS